MDQSSIERQLRALKIYCVVLTCALGVAVLAAAAGPATREISVERIDIVDASGKPRLVISNGERFPPTILGGRKYQRAVRPAGIVFYDDRGDEVGGLALSQRDGGRLSALAFDYSNADAVALLTKLDPGGRDALAGLVINSRPDESLPPTQAGKSGNPRVRLQNHNESAELVLSDPQGRPRLRLSVAPDGKPRIEMLDERGASVYSVER